MRTRIRVIVSLTVSFLLSAVVAWGLTEAYPYLQLLIVGAYALVFLGAAIPPVYESVPEYRNVGFILVGIVAGFIYILDANNLSLLAVAIGVAHLISILHSTNVFRATDP